ncbi:MAG TPA: RNA methyltransferase, partial [Tepidisphaeraceae bacterium]|nr:RNA methyltransferase [Tepidisphaeraceae bacterium]
LGEECCDPYYRQAVRVSMGAVFALPIVRSTDIRRDLMRLRNEHRCECWATVLDADASLLGSIERPPRLCLLMGNEAQGLERDLVALCDQRVTIPMRLGT